MLKSGLAYFFQDVDGNLKQCCLQLNIAIFFNWNFFCHLNATTFSQATAKNKTNSISIIFIFPYPIFNGPFTRHTECFHKNKSAWAGGYQLPALLSSISKSHKVIISKLVLHAECFPVDGITQLKILKAIQIRKNCRFLWDFPSRALVLLCHAFRSFHFNHYALSFKGFSAISPEFLQLVQNLAARKLAKARTFEHWCALTTNIAMRRKKKLQNTTFLHFSCVNNS